jgi:Protein of unknown function (DUF2815)
MSTTRELTSLYLYNAQALFIDRLFDPETKDFAGKPLDKPSYSVLMRFPKTMPNWYDEPQLQAFRETCRKVMDRDLAGVPFQYVEFPIKDGDKPNKQGKTPDWAVGHWTIRASTTFIPLVEQMVDGVQTQIASFTMGGRKLWKNGDFCCVEVNMGKRLNDNVGIRCYLKGVIFTCPGAEVSVGGGAPPDWKNAFAQADAQGIKIKTGGGFNPGDGFPGGQQGGFNPGAAPGGFNPGQQGAQGGFNPGAAPGGFPGGQQGAQGGFNPGPGPGAASGSFGQQQGGFTPGATDPNKPPF